MTVIHPWIWIWFAIHPWISTRYTSPFESQCISWQPECMQETHISILFALQFWFIFGVIDYINPRRSLLDWSHKTVHHFVFRNWTSRYTINKTTMCYLSEILPHRRWNTLFIYCKLYDTLTKNSYSKVLEVLKSHNWMIIKIYMRNVVLFFTFILGWLTKFAYLLFNKHFANLY